MESRILQQSRLAELLDKMILDHEVMAPKDEQAYGEVDSSSEVRLSSEKPVKSFKEAFFPQREVLLKYKLGPGSEVTLEDAPSPGEGRRIIFAARPCDAAASPIIDQVFKWDYLDVSFLALRESTVIVSLACEEPCKACFCTSLGGSPAGTEGSDILLTPLGDAYHVQVLTEKGKELVDEYGGFFQDSSEDLDRQSEAREVELREKVTRSVDLTGLAESLDHENPVWNTIAQQCVDCGICTFLCPTCHCFDVQDEGKPDGGERVRCWDACAFSLYTKMPVGQPRPTHYRRYRQRIMHKFKYYPENFGKTLCVGCGRCIEYCPVGVELTRVLEAAKE